MKRVKYLILGAGPSGLTLAHQLLERGETSFLVLEKESKAGGLCRSEIVDGSPLDIGGGHFLDVRKKEVTEFLFKFLPETGWNKYSRISNIYFQDKEINYPFESHIWQLELNSQIDFLESIAQAGCIQGTPKPKSFKDWISWKLGDLVAKHYMIPYNEKIWSIPLEDLGTYWLEKLPNVSFRDTLQSCLRRELAGELPAHAEFLYPKNYGYGEVWERMGSKLEERIIYDIEIKSINVEELSVNETYSAEKIINTIPWKCFSSSSGIPNAIRANIKALQNSSIVVAYQDKNIDTDAHWLYVPDKGIDYHRILCRSNFCEGSKGHWTETNALRAKKTSSWHHINEFAYPLNTINKPQQIQEILSWGKTKNIYGLGRWGEWQHMNSDVAVQGAINFTRDLLRENN